MPLTIHDEYVRAQAQKLAALTGQSIDAAIGEAIAETLGGDAGERRVCSAQLIVI